MSARGFKCLICHTRTSLRFDECPKCGEWDTCGRTLTSTRDDDGSSIVDQFQILGNVKAHEPARIRIGEEWDKALGFPDHPGLALGSEMILWGKPGAHKTTEMLRVCASIDGACYLNAELHGSNGAPMLKMLADRASIDVSGVATMFVTSPREVADAIRAVRWRLAVVDSVNALIPAGHPMSAKAMREATGEILEAKREIGCALVCIMHARRDGEIAAPAWALHMCDAVVQLSAQWITVPKNRFGPQPVRVKRKRAPLRIVA